MFNLTKILQAQRNIYNTSINAISLHHPRLIVPIHQ